MRIIYFFRQILLHDFERVLRYQRNHGTRALIRELDHRLKNKFLFYGLAYRLKTGTWVNRLANRLKPAPVKSQDPALPAVLHQDDSTWLNRLANRLNPAPVRVQDPALPAALHHDDSGWVSGREMAQKHHQHCAPLRLFRIPGALPRRISLVTDSINRGSLYGGVGTSIIMAALAAQAMRVRLRIVTRTEPANPEGLRIVLRTYGLTLPYEVEFVHAPFHDIGYEIDAFDDELFITTSWWTTAATLASVRSESIVYLLQEDERMFYPYGDEHLRCSQILGNNDIRFVINTKLLFDHLVSSGLTNVAAKGLWFEPAFPHEVFRPGPREPGGKLKLLFYARPFNTRNLFYFGIEVLEAAIARGIVDLDVWDIAFVGKDIPRLRLHEGSYTPKRLENLSWTDYAQLAGQTDLALSLMYTPHPSYPPLDMAASGAVVVTNQFSSKRSLASYSNNIICGDLNLKSMLEAMARGVELALDTEQRTRNYEANQLGRVWQTSFAGVLQRFTSPH